MTQTAVVTTSINRRPESYAWWANAAHLVVAGDVNSPRELEAYVADLGGVYLDTVMQRRWSFSETIGWRCIQRRNTAIMHAYALGCNPIITVDDDNFPTPTAAAFIEGHIAQFGSTNTKSTIGTLSGFLNTGMFCLPQFHARGVPYGVDANNIVVHVSDRSTTRVVVSQAQVLGDPDCDAIERLCNAPNVIALAANAIVTPGTYTAFNSQATVWSRDWAPVMAVLPGIGRYDDIFASFIFARLAHTYDVTLFVGEPCVRQIRNDHDIVADLRAELWGMHHVFEFCRLLNEAHISADMPLPAAYGELITATESVLPPQTVKFAHEWVRTWQEIG